MNIADDLKSAYEDGYEKGFADGFEAGQRDVQPERKKGKWNFIGDQMFECTKCGTCYTQSQFHQMRVRITDSEFPNFCPNCGSYNGGET